MMQSSSQARPSPSMGALTWISRITRGRTSTKRKREKSSMEKLNERQDVALGERERRVVDAVDKMREEIDTSLSEMIKIPSISPKFPGVTYEEFLGNEGDASRHLGQIYSAAGVVPDFWEVEPKRTNVAATYQGSGDGRSLINNGHVDVVPPGQREKWQSGDPFSGRIDDDKVWGRGACDMKAGLIAQAFALKVLVDQNIRLRGDLILQGTVGEERSEERRVGKGRRGRGRASRARRSR